MATDQPPVELPPATPAVAVHVEETRFDKVRGVVRRNRLLVSGVALIVAVILFGTIGQLFIDEERSKVGAGPIARPPSLEHFLGTDVQGRDVLADVVYGTPATLRLGLIAGVLGVAAGTILAFTGGYFGGRWDAIVRLMTDVFLTVPALLVIIIIAELFDVISIEAMGLLIAGFAWMGPARTIRPQVLTLRERTYVKVAKLNGMSNLEIIFKELMPNMMPYLAASLVGAVASAILISIGISALGLGPQNEPSIGLTIFWAIHHGAMIRVMWWWLAPSVVIVVVLFLGLFMMTAGLDKIANPRLQTTV